MAAEMPGWPVLIEARYLGDLTEDARAAWDASIGASSELVHGDQTSWWLSLKAVVEASHWERAEEKGRETFWAALRHSGLAEKMTDELHVVSLNPEPSS
jgi:hypothetical protein